MLYVHRLESFTARTADIESVYKIRELKQKMKYPFQQAEMDNQLLYFSVSPTDLKLMAESLELLAPTIQLLKKIAAEQNSLHEAVNLHRALKILEELPVPLRQNIAYAQEITALQEQLGAQLTPVLNIIPKLKASEEKVAANKKISDVFRQLLRTEDFRFNFQDVIYEAQLNHIQGLETSLSKGYLFHISLEEELKKLNFEAIRQRIPAPQLEEADLVTQQVAAIRKGVERAYELNMRMVALSFEIYSYGKWVVSGP